MARPLRTVIVDSSTASRDAIRALLRGLPAAEVVAEFATIAEAMQRAQQSHPDLLVVEVPADGDGSLPAAGIERLLRQLPETAILATAPPLPAEAVVQIIRAGALEVLRRPVEERDFRTAVAKLLRFRGSAAPRRQGRVTAIYSVKGGLGATTLAVNLGAALAAEAPDRVVLAELDTRPSDVVALLDLRPRYSIVDFLESIDRMDDSLLQGLMSRHPSGLAVLPAPTRMERTHLAAELVGIGLQLLRAPFNHVVLDLRHDLDPATIAALEDADRILYVTALNVAALRSAAAGLAALRHVGIDTKKLKVVIMRGDTGGDITLTHAREALGLPVYWSVPNDYRTVVEAINTGHPAITASPRSKVSKSLHQLAHALATEASDVLKAPASSRPLLAAAWPLRHLSGA